MRLRSTIEFASWVSPEFKLYIIKDYQRLKKDEAERKAIGWDEKRALSKINYHIHTDAVQKYLITDELPSIEKAYTFADEAGKIKSNSKLNSIGYSSLSFFCYT